MRYAAGATVVAVLILATMIWMKPADLGASLAFADVQEAMRQIKTVVYDLDFPSSPHRNMRMLFIRGIDRGRVEWPAGLAFVTDFAQGRTLILDHKNKTSQLTSGPSADFTAGEVFDKLANVEQEAMKRLGERVFDGRTLVGFLLEREERLRVQVESRVWVDLKTRLPVRMETVPLDPDDPRAPHLRMIARFTFNEPLDDALFSLKPPEGYKILEADAMQVGLGKMPVPPAPKDNNLASPVIDPGVGIGRARFGMTLEQVIEALGQPAGMSEHWELPAELSQALSDVEKKVKEQSLDDAERQRLLEEVEKKYNVEIDEDPGGRTGTVLPRGDPNGVSLSYDDRGFELTILDDRGLCGIECVTGRSGKRDFSGKTSRGIAMGASREEIEKAYGPADTKSQYAGGTVRLQYESLGMTFSLTDDRLWQMSFSRK
jgi:hypothetical protein